MSKKQQYYLKGQMLGACNCGWGCPCNFEEPPTAGFCEGTYVWHVETGGYAGVTLDGCTFAMCNTFPGAIHLGNGNGVVIVDDSVKPEQRAAIESMIQEAAPFSVFIDLTANFLGFRYQPFELSLNGIRSRASIPGTLELELAPIKNPVTGEDELAVLNKPTGFTSKIQELCSADTHRFETEGMSFHHDGRYGEFSLFEYPMK